MRQVVSSWWSSSSVLAVAAWLMFLGQGSAQFQAPLKRPEFAPVQAPLSYRQPQAMVAVPIGVVVGSAPIQAPVKLPLQAPGKGLDDLSSEGLSPSPFESADDQRVNMIERRLDLLQQAVEELTQAMTAVAKANNLRSLPENLPAKQSPPDAELMPPTGAAQSQSARSLASGVQNHHERTQLLINQLRQQLRQGEHLLQRATEAQAKAEKTQRTLKSDLEKIEAVLQAVSDDAPENPPAEGASRSPE